MTLTLADPQVGLAGDWHGFAHAVGPAFSAFAKRKIEHVFHVGDFGLLPGPKGEQFLTHVDRMCARHGITLYVTPGNHEDWDLIDEHEPGKHGLLWFGDHVAVMPRGYRWTVFERTFLSLGGAASIDFADLTPKVDWWAGEAITYGDALHAIAGGPADVMIVHDAPDGGTTAIQRIIDGPSTWGERATNYAAESRQMITEVWQEVGPKFLAHGHFHVTANEVRPLHNGNQCRVMSLNMQDHFGNLAVLDVSDDLPVARFIDQ